MRNIRGEGRRNSEGGSNKPETNKYNKREQFRREDFGYSARRRSRKNKIEITKSRKEEE